MCIQYHQKIETMTKGAGNSIEWKERFQQIALDSLRRALSLHDTLAKLAMNLFKKISSEKQR